MRLQQPRVRPAGLQEWLLLLLLATIWSLSFALIKLAVTTLPPINLAAFRLVLAALVLGLLLRFRGRRLSLAPQNLAHYLFIGLFGNALPFSLIGWGELRIDSGLAAIFMGLMPLLTLLLAHYLVPDEPLSPSRVLGIVLGFSGVLVILGPEHLVRFDGELVAQLAVLLAAFCYSITTIYTRRRAHLPGPELATGATAAGAILLLPLAWIEAPWPTLAPAPEALAAAVGLGIFATGLATVIYFHLIRTIGASRFSQVNYIIPVLGALWGVLVMGEQLGWSAWAALALIIGGIALVNRARAEK